MDRYLFKRMIAVVCLLVVPTVAQASLKARLQKRLESNEGKNQNVQYQPYYLESNYGEANASAPMAPRVESDEAVMPKQEQVLRAQTGRLRAARFSSPVEKCSKSIAPQSSNFVIYNVSYTGTLEDNVVTVKGKIVFEVFDHPYLKRAEIPLVNDQVGLIDVQVNHGKSFVMSRGGKYFLVIDKPGRYTLDIEYLLKVQRERENGPGSFHVDVMPAPISQFEFIVPEENVQVFIDPAIKVETEYEDKKTVAWAVMPNTNAIDVRWTKALPKTTIEKVELEPKIYAEISTFVSIGGGVVQARSEIKYSILQAEVSSFRLALPKDVSVLSVNSKEMRDWKVSKEGDIQYLDVFLNFGTKGTHAIDVVFERNIEEGQDVISMPWIRALGVERENGFYGIAASTNLEIKVDNSDRVTRIDSKQLPRFIWSQASRPILLAFKYLNHPFTINIEMTRHEEVPVLVAAIDSAQPETLLTKDGKALTKLTFHIRNNVKQYLRIKLPETATVWSSFVNGEPVKPAKDKKGNILISLKKSNGSGDNVTQFPVEIVYLDESPVVKGMGSLKLVLPKIDLPVNQMDWRVYLPENFSYFGARSDGDVTAPGRGRIRKNDGFIRRTRNVTMKSETRLNQQVSFKSVVRSDKEWGQKTKGLLPIKIDIPRRGDAFKVSKLLVVDGDQPWFSVRYISWGPTARGWVKFLKIVLFLGVLLWLAMKFRRKKKP